MIAPIVLNTKNNNLSTYQKLATITTPQITNSGDFSRVRTNWDYSTKEVFNLKAKGKYLSMAASDNKLNFKTTILNYPQIVTIIVKTKIASIKLLTFRIFCRQQCALLRFHKNQANYCKTGWFQVKEVNRISSIFLPSSIALTCLSVNNYQITEWKSLTDHLHQLTTLTAMPIQATSNIVKLMRQQFSCLN